MIAYESTIKKMGVEIDLVKNPPECSHAQTLLAMISWAEQCTLCTSYLDKGGIEIFLPDIQNRGEKLSTIIIANEEKGYIKPGTISLIKKSAKKQSLLIKLFSHSAKRLHSKIYLFEKNDEYKVMIGSANLTKRGLTENEEFSARLSGKTSDPYYIEIKEYLKSILKNSAQRI